MHGTILTRINDRLWWLLLVTLVVRGSALWFGQAALQDDPDAYQRLATNWASVGVMGVESADGTRVSPSAFRPPLYPWLLNWLVRPISDDISAVPLHYSLSALSVSGLHLILGLLTVWLTWSIARDMQLRWPWLPALWVACDPILLRASQLVMTETLAACLVVVAWKLWLVVYPLKYVGRAETSSHAVCGLPSAQSARTLTSWLALVGLGLVWGLSILARPTAAPWVAACMLGVVSFSSPCWKRRINDGLILSLLVAACLAPWVLRNLSQFGKPIWATTHGGYTLLLANNPLLYHHFSQQGPSRAWDAEPFHARWATRLDPAQTRSPDEQSFWSEPAPESTDLGAPSEQRILLSELADDRLAYSAAWGTIERQPGMFALSSLYRAGWLWAAWPHMPGITLEVVAIGLWYVGLYALAIWGLSRGIANCGWRGWLERWWLPLMLVLSLTAVHAVYWSNMRMRAPAIAAIALAAASVWPARQPHDLPHCRSTLRVES